MCKMFGILYYISNDVSRICIIQELSKETYVMKLYFYRYSANFLCGLAKTWT